MINLNEIRKLPKIELHRHLDGAVKPELIFDLAKKHNVYLPVNSLEDLKKYYRITKETSVQELMDKFDVVLSLMQTPENLQTIAYEQILDLKKENYLYVELRFAPQYHTREGLSMVQVIENVLIGMRKGYKETGILSNLIIAIGREAELEKAKQIVKAALEFQNSQETVKVVGIDLACDEATYPPEIHLPAYKLTFGSKLKRTVHAGEFGDQKLKNIKTAIHKLRADRIGHAIPLPNDKDLLNLVKQKRIGIESNPLSNLICHMTASIQELKLNIYFTNGIKFSLGSDDPAMMYTTLSNVIYETAKVYNWGLAHIKTIMKNSIDISFTSNKEKQSLKQNLDKTWPKE